MNISRHILPDVLLSIILIIGGAELVYGLLQLCGMTHSQHVAYPVTGHFYNPGPYGCFLAVILPLGLCGMMSGSNKLQKWLCTGIVFASAILIPATLSRTALMACCIGSAVALCRFVSAKVLAGRGYGAIIAVVVVSLAIAAGGYFMKKDSADGRFLMWKVAALAAMDAPPTGVGWANVPGAYGEAQEQYFAAGNGSERDMMVADAPEYVFNEYLQVAIAYGPLMAVAVIMVMVCGIIVALSNRSYGFAGSAVAVMVVMSASYPLQFPMFVMTIGMIIAGCYLSARSIGVKLCGSAVAIMACVLFHMHSQTVDAYDGFSVGHALHRAGDYHKSNKHMQELLSYTSDPMPLNIIGKNYQALAMPDSAEHYYRRAAYRCPNRLYPHYLLMLLYADPIIGNHDAMMHEAEILLTKKEKIASPAVEDMRIKAREILKELK